MTDSDGVMCEGPECDEIFVPNVHNQKYCTLDCKDEAKRARRRRDLVADVTRAVASSYEVEDEFDEDRLLYLSSENSRLERLVKKYKGKHSEHLDSLYRAAYDALSSLEIKPVKPPKNKSDKYKDDLFANPAISDSQIGKVTPSYNIDVCEERMSLYADKVLEYTELHRNTYNVNTAHVHMLGDIVEGEDIFPGNSFQIEASLYRQVTRAVEINADFARRLLSNFDKVHYTCVIGNHGLLSSRRRGDYNPETNMDRLVYRFMSMLFENEPRISFHIPDGDGHSNFYAVDQMGNYRVLLIHGDQLNAPTSMHGYYKKVLGWKDSGIEEDFDDVKMGHWHQNTKATFGSTVVRICGTPESHNLYAQERIGVMGRPSQHLEFVHPVYGVLSEYDVYLDMD